MERKHSYYKPKYKKLLRLKENVYNTDKFFKLKKKKWQILVSVLAKKKKKKFWDQIIYYKPRFGRFFNKKYKFNLILKQKINCYYGNLLKKTLKKINKIVYKRFLQNSNKYSNFVKLDQFFLEYFESRLDVIIFRSFFVNSLRESKKLIKNGHVFVNCIKITVNSFLIKKSDIIAFSEHCLPLLKQNINKIFSTNVLSFSPKYLEINYSTFQIVLVSNVKAYNFFDISLFKLNFKKLNKYLLHI